MATTTVAEKQSGKKKKRKARKAKYNTEVPDILGALDEAARGDARAAIKIVQDVIDPVQCSPLEVPPERLPEVARVWGITARQNDCERSMTLSEPACGEAWTWEPLAADHWFEFLVVTDHTRDPKDAQLVQKCLEAFRGAYFMLAEQDKVGSTASRKGARKKTATKKAASGRKKKAPKGKPAPAEPVIEQRRLLSL